MSFNKFRAFTLVELLVVIVIVGLLSSVTLVITQGIREQGRIAKSLQFSQHLENSLGDYLVARWNFDEGTDITIEDSSGWGNDGTLGNGLCVPGSNSCPNWSNDTPSNQGYSLSFDGINDYVDAKTNPSLLGPFAAVTVEAWIKTENPGYIASGRYPNTFSSGFVLATNLFYVFTDGTPSEGGTTSTFIVQDNKWHHVVGTYNKSTGDIKFYVDGENKTSGISNGNVKAGVRMFIGSRAGSDSWFKGSMDEVNIYSTAITASQIKSQYYIGLEKLLAKGLINQREYQNRLTIN